MVVDLENGKLTSNGNDMSLVLICNKLQELSAADIMNFFMKRDIKLPRNIKMNSLKKILRKIFDNNYDTLDVKKAEIEEMSETELEYYFNRLATRSHYLILKTELWLQILLNSSLSINDDELKFLLSSTSTEYDNFKSFMQLTKEITYDNPDSFDGLAHNDFINRLMVMDDDVVDIINKKYDLNISYKLKKDDLLEKLKNHLTSCGKYSEPEFNNIKAFTYGKLTSYLKQNQVSYLNKKNRMQLKEDIQAFWQTGYYNTFDEETKINEFSFTSILNPIDEDSIKEILSFEQEKNDDAIVEVTSELEADSSLEDEGLTEPTIDSCEEPIEEDTNQLEAIENSEAQKEDNNITEVDLETPETSNNETQETIDRLDQTEEIIVAPKKHKKLKIFFIIFSIILFLIILYLLIIVLSKYTDIKIFDTISDFFDDKLYLEKLNNQIRKILEKIHK